MEAPSENALSRIIAIGRDFRPETREGLIDGTLELTLSHPLPALAKPLFGAMLPAVARALLFEPLGAENP